MKTFIIVSVSSKRNILLINNFLLTRFNMTKRN